MEDIGSTSYSINASDTDWTLLNKEASYLFLMSSGHFQKCYLALGGHRQATST